MLCFNLKVAPKVKNQTKTDWVDLLYDQQPLKVGKEQRLPQDRMDVLWETFKATVLLSVQHRQLGRLFD